MTNLISRSELAVVAVALLVMCGIISMCPTIKPQPTITEEELEIVETAIKCGQALGIRIKWEDVQVMGIHRYRVRVDSAKVVKFCTVHEGLVEHLLHRRVKSGSQH